jgi:hypothetical protein
MSLMSFATPAGVEGMDVLERAEPALAARPA